MNKKRKSEDSRIRFIYEHDGVDAMLKWVEQTLNIYVNESCNLGIYKDSIDVLVETLNGYGLEVSLVRVTKKEEE